MKNLLNIFNIQKIQELIKSNNKIIFLTIAVCLIITYLDFTFLINKQLGNIKRLESKIVKLKKDLNSLENDLVRMQDIKNKQAQTKPNIISKVKIMILEENIASLFQDISSLANKNDVKIVQIRPSRELHGEKLNKDLPMAKFAPLLINLDLFCDYHHLGKFINDLENAQTFISVENIKISSQPTDILRQRVSLVLRTYVRK